MRISIALASYNGERFIREQLESFALQTRQPDEVVICDDGSTDRTQEIVESFAAAAPFAVAFNANPERLGYTRNFERAISLCKGDIIFLSDQDDVWFPEKLDRIVTEFEQSPASYVVVNDQVITDGDLRESGITKLGNLRAIGRSSDHLIEGCCTAVRRAWVELLLPIPDSAAPLLANHMLAYDRWLNELAVYFQVRKVVDRPLQLFRRHGANVTSWLMSEPRAIGLSDLVKTRSKSVPIEAWQQRIDALDFYDQWITKRCSAFEAHGISTSDAALATVREEQRSLNARIAISKAPRLRRIVMIARLWSQDGYVHFHGWKSAVRDIFRPAAPPGCLP